MALFAWEGIDGSKVRPERNLAMVLAARLFQSCPAEKSSGVVILLILFGLLYPLEVLLNLISQPVFEWALHRVGDNVFRTSCPDLHGMHRHCCMLD